MLLSQPFFGTIALKMRLVEDSDRETMSTDGYVLRYNPKFVKKLPIMQLQGVIAHEVMHIALLHHVRRGVREHRKWNIACDFAINQILLSMGMQLPRDALFDPKYDGMSAEEIYAQLPDTETCISMFGSSDDPGGCGSVDDAPGDGRGGGAMDAESAAKMLVAHALAVGRKFGKMPAELARTIEKILDAKHPWRETLANFASVLERSEPLWRTPNRRFLASKCYLPGCRPEPSRLGEIVVVIDTSGSIEQRMLDDFATEVRGLVDAVRPETVHVLYCDAAVANVESFDADSDITFEPKGGGGTDFRPAFEWVYNNAAAPKLMLYFTDGCGVFPDDPPPFPVMWVFNSSKHPTAPFGESVVCELDT